MILERLENLPVGSFHYKLLIVTGLGWLFDSMDTGLISFVLPVLAKEWGLTPEQVGWIGSIGLIGMALGAVLAGTVADRLGRKKVFAATVILYSVSTINGTLRGCVELRKFIIFQIFGRIRLGRRIARCCNFNERIRAKSFARKIYSFA